MTSKAILYYADINECIETPCNNGGTCTNSEGGFSCNCEREYDGATCSICKHDMIVILIPKFHIYTFIL